MVQDNPTRIGPLAQMARAMALQAIGQGFESLAVHIMDIKAITEKYNQARKNFSFPTTSASESGVESILKLYPELKELPEDEMIEKIGIVIYHLAFD